jgi:predicted translin family RNA/ssDNA-binding protein
MESEVSLKHLRREELAALLAFLNSLWSESLVKVHFPKDLESEFDQKADYNI